MQMWSVHQRLAEFWTIKKNRPLTTDEGKEMELCLEANANKAWKLAELDNLCSVAYTLNDMDWMHVLCQQIEEVYPYGIKP